MSEQIRADLCIIGAGSGGLSVAAGAAQLGARVVLIEKAHMGGDCLNVGCVPSKALIAAARRAHNMRTSAPFGIVPVTPAVNPSAVRDHVQSVIAAIAPNDSWWKEPTALGADPRFPNPASEPVLAAQQHLLDEALSNLDDERPDVTDLYFVGFAGDAREDVFRKDVLAAQRVMDERWGTEGRSLALINNPRTLLEAPAATVTNLRETLNEIGAAIDADQDVVMIYLASHGSRRHVLEVALPPLELAPLTAPALRGLLDAAGIKWRIVVVSACYSGGFIEALQDDNTLVLTASAADRASFGCGHRSESTFFGEALFQHGLAHSESLLAAFEAARGQVAEREKAGAFTPPSDPQIFVGPAMADKLRELDRGNAARRSGRSV